MGTSASPKRNTVALAVAVCCGDEMIRVQLSDGREISAPLEWFPSLRDASSAQRANWRAIGRGIGIHWPDLDEDISIESLLQS